MRFTLVLPMISLLAVAGCGEVDLQKAGTNAALAALEASNPEVVAGIRAARTLQLAAATCGWQDVDATSLARTAVSGIEEAPLRAAATSLVEDLMVANVPAPQGASPANECSPEARQALQSQIAAISQSEAEEAGG